MLTVEKFYFNFEDEAACHITMGSDGTDWTIKFVGADDAPVSIKITMRGRDEFRKLIKHLHDLGTGILEAGESRDTQPQAKESATNADAVAMSVNKFKPTTCA